MASKLAKSGRKVLSPLGHSSKPSSKTTATSSPASTTTRSETVTSSPSSVDATIADQLGSVASAAGTLTSGLTSSIASASSSFGSLLFASQSSSISNTDEVEERSSSADRAAEEAAAVAAEAAEVLRQVSAQQRMRILEDLVQHRRSDWNYLKAMHEGSNYWLNVALLREQQVMNHVGYKQSIRRGAQFFYLGIGLGRLVGESTHPELLAMDCCQLLEELEFYFSSSTVQGMKLFIDPVKKEFSAVASQVMAEEMRLVRKAYASGSREEPLPTPQSESENTPATNGD
ncbi:Sec14 cytosolic factor [Phytophthora nicotianae]|uniref:Sec14 cytosolic factor n=1 Tax=Phytophthora nicotianae TaxID=4792 RepID=A0A0W8DH06_PHYNI|nr:Sec14 cytosolic factor [Phytophthora nicotianae]